MRRAAVAVALLALAATLASAQGNEGHGVAPDRLVVPDAQPGETYLRTLGYQHQFDTAGTIRVEVDGPESSWVTTDPPSGFQIPPRTNRDITVTIKVPDGAALGEHSTTLRLTRQSQEPPGSGTTVEPSVGVHLAITVGGQERLALRYLSARVEDAKVGSPVQAFVLARNDGNVRATAEAEGTVLPFATDSPALSSAAGSLVLVPGEEAEIPLVFPAGLPQGQYRARLTAAGLDETLPFKVTIGDAPDGALHALVHEPYVKAGRLARVDARFENTGTIPIASATFHAEVRRGDELLATLESKSLVVPAGVSVNLTVYWTPPRPGTYTLSGQVTYDGYQTLPKQSPLNVTGGASEAWSWWWLLLLLIVLAILAIWWAWRRGRKDRRRPQR